MVCDEELTPHGQQNKQGPHVPSHWFVKTCLQTIGASEEAVREGRLEPPWLVLLWLGPIYWLRVVALVSSLSYPRVPQCSLGYNGSALTCWKVFCRSCVRFITCEWYCGSLCCSPMITGMRRLGTALDLPERFRT
jgi:hypothetical protein